MQPSGLNPVLSWHCTNTGFAALGGPANPMPRVAAEPQPDFLEQPPVAAYLTLQITKHNSILRGTLLNAFQLFVQRLSFVFCCFVHSDAAFTVICFSFFLHPPREGRGERGEGRREKGERRREKGEGRREKGEGRREKGSVSGSLALWGPSPGTRDHPSTLPGNPSRTLSFLHP